MIIRFFAKYWRLLFDIALIAVLVFLIILWNPFGIFGGGTKLQKTANIVTQVRDIGELVTAEYYGEVIASLHETRFEILAADSVDEKAYDWFVLLKYDLYDILLENEKNRDQRKALEQYVNTLFQGGGEYSGFIGFYREVVMNRRKHKAKKLKQDYAEVITNLFSDIEKKRRKLDDNEFYSYLNENFYSPESYSQYSRKKVSDELKKKNLAMIGRGWVKAGYDLSRLHENRVIYNKDLAEIHLFGVSPKIIDADINPWFIPENRIQGFQILAASGNVTFNEVVEVKLQCIQKLRDKALEADILGRAEIYGNESLKNFFSLLTGTEIKRVVLHANVLDAELDEIVQDGVISAIETQKINKSVKAQLDEIDSLSKNDDRDREIAATRMQLLHEYITELKKYPWRDANSSLNFSFYAARANKYLFTNEILVAGEANNYIQLANLRYPVMFTVKDSANPDSVKFNVPAEIVKSLVWFDDSTQFMSEFNDFALYLHELKPAMIVKQGNAEIEIPYATDQYPDFRKLMYPQPGMDSVLQTILNPDSLEVLAIASKLQQPDESDNTEGFVTRLRAWATRKSN